jgi:hypothetical protein
MAEDKNEVIVVRIPRDANTEAVVKTLTFWRTDVVDIRWYNNGKPTQKGFRCNINEAKTLSRALQKIVSGLNENKQTSDEEET